MQFLKICLGQNNYFKICCHENIVLLAQDTLERLGVTLLSAIQACEGLELVAFGHLLNQYMFADFWPRVAGGIA